MAFNSEDLSGSESDDGFDEDMEALKRACLITGTKPYHHLHPSTAATSNSDGVASAAESEDGEEEEDDLELIRKMQQRFSGDGFEEPLNLKPICSLPPVLDSDNDDDSDDDFQILRAIQRRFSDYNSGK